MASTINYGGRIPDREVRVALQQGADEIGALSGIVATQATQISALSGHVAAFQATLTVAGTDVTTVANTVNGLLAKLVAAGLMAAS